jgi:hypothetical protein
MVAAACDRSGGHVGEITELIVAPARSPAASGEAVVEVSPEGAERVRVTARDDSAFAEAVFGSAPGGPSPEAPPEILAAAAMGGGPENGDRIRDILGDHGAEPIRWARSNGSTVVVGGARLGAASDAAGVVARLLRCAATVASYGWCGLTGSRHRLAAIERVRLHDLPAPGEELVVHARMTTPHAGGWRADVTVLDARGRVAAELTGAAGVPVADLPAAAGSHGAGDAAAAWRALSREMQAPAARREGRDC